MRYLLDTHTLLWFITDDPCLPRPVRSEIRHLNNYCAVSIASLWEMGIKSSLGKLCLKKPLKEIFTLIQNYPFDVLAVSPDHILKLDTLPLHHRYPFDRILITQAQAEQLVLISNDKKISSYDVTIKWS